MKKLILLLLAVGFGCSPQNITPTAPVTDDVNVDLTGIAPVKMGVLTGQQGHTASGTAAVYQKSGKTYIVLDPYSSQSGPDLKVYLSKDEGASDYIRVGPLKSTTGRQTYEVMGNPDLTKYLFVHVWCEKFTVEFARAPLN